MNEIIESEYESVKQKSRIACWAILKETCKQQSVPTPSYTSFCSAVRNRNRFKQTLKRQGPRAAYQHGPFHMELDLKTPRHGDRPFEICHLDHTQLDIELTDTAGTHKLGRPWMTLMIDAFSRRILALHVDFEEPSYRSCMMVLRECVRRHNRLPQCLVVDWGAEFRSTYFEALLARYECTKKARPPAKARFGSLVERAFGTTNTQFIHNLVGNTQITRNVRQVTKSVNPKELAIWPLAPFMERLWEYAYDIYDTNVHPALGESPKDAYERGFQNSGSRLHRLIPYDHDFMIATLPSTPRGTAMVSPGRGVKINYIFYWCDGMDDPKIQGQQIPVRFDPFDLGTAYAFIGRPMGSMPLGPLPDLSGPVAEGVAGRLERATRTKSGARFTVSAHGQQTGAGLSVNRPAGIAAVAANAHSGDPGSERAERRLLKSVRTARSRTRQERRVPWSSASRSAQTGKYSSVSDEHIQWRLATVFLAQPPSVRLRHFKDFAVAHTDAGGSQGPPPGGHHGVRPELPHHRFGPTGVGKTTLLAKIRQLLSASAARR